jgi:hypothetical protein
LNVPDIALHVTGPLYERISQNGVFLLIEYIVVTKLSNGNTIKSGNFVPIVASVTDEGPHPDASWRSLLNN